MMATNMSGNLSDSGIIFHDGDSDHHSTSTITDDEFICLAHNLPPRNVQRIAVECLRIRHIDVDHAKSISASDSVKFVTLCLQIWIQQYTGSNFRDDLHKCLTVASEKKLLKKDSYQFLKSDCQQQCRHFPDKKGLIAETKENARFIQNIEISDQEISSLAHKLPYQDIRSCALEFLHLPKINIEHAEVSSEGDAGIFATKCINLWINRYSGGNIREDLRICLGEASTEGLINSAAYSFLDTTEVMNPTTPLQSMTADNGNILKHKELRLEISNFSEVDQNEITSVEMSKLAYNAPPNCMRRIAIEFLNISRIAVDHAARDAGKNSWKFAYKCFTIWRNKYSGNNTRADLHRSLSLASVEGIMAADIYICFLENQRCDGGSPFHQ